MPTAGQTSDLLLLAQLLSSTPRRYRLPTLPDLSQPLDTRDANKLALVIEHARLTLAAGQEPRPALQQAFVDTLAALIREAMQEEGSDPALQALLLRQQSSRVQEYTALALEQPQDKRRILSLVNAVAHPGKLQGMVPGPGQAALARLQQAAVDENWPEVQTLAAQALSLADGAGSTSLVAGLNALREAPSLQRLQLYTTLQADPQVQRYLNLKAQNGPHARSDAASRQGSAARRRGMEVETLTIHSLNAWADRLNEAAQQPGLYRVVSSLRVPAILAGGHSGAKTEWDAVLLRQPVAQTGSPVVWDVSLLVEAKASVDAVSTDLPRLLRGLHLLAQARASQDYDFECREGPVRLSGASLKALDGSEFSRLAAIVLYSSDDPADEPPRLLSAASRMLLLSAPASLAYAGALAAAQPADTSVLQPLWHDLLHSPHWKRVLNQYPTLQQGRALMVHVEDMLTALHCGDSQSKN